MGQMFKSGHLCLFELLEDDVTISLEVHEAESTFCQTITHDNDNSFYADSRRIIIVTLPMANLLLTTLVLMKVTDEQKQAKRNVCLGPSCFV